MGQHAAPKEDSDVSSAELVTGHHSSYQVSYCTCRILHMSSCCCLLHSSHQYAAASPGQDRTRLCACLWPAEASRAPYASPFRMVSKRTLTIQVGQRQETISMDRLKAHTGLSPVAPVKAASAAAPPRSQPLLHSSLHLHEAKEWVGGHVEDPMVVYLNIYFVCVSHYYCAIEAINLCM